MGNENTFTFEIVSRKHGRFTVTAPVRFRDHIEALTWCVLYDSTRADGRRFTVATNAPHPNGGLRRDGTPRFQMLYLHRLIWTLAGGEPARLLDHVDGNPLNNAEENIRAATPRGNGANARLLRNNTSGYKGVSWDRKSRNWRAQIASDTGGRDTIGWFATAEEAAAAYDEAAARKFGAFAVVNRDIHGRPPLPPAAPDCA